MPLASPPAGSVPLRCPVLAGVKWHLAVVLVGIAPMAGDLPAPFGGPGFGLFVRPSSCVFSPVAPAAVSDLRNRLSPGVESCSRGFIYSFTPS